MIFLKGLINSDTTLLSKEWLKPLFVDRWCCFFLLWGMTQTSICGYMMLFFSSLVEVDDVVVICHLHHLLETTNTKTSWYNNNINITTSLSAMQWLCKISYSFVVCYAVITLILSKGQSLFTSWAQDFYQHSLFWA